MRYGIADAAADFVGGMEKGEQRAVQLEDQQAKRDTRQLQLEAARKEMEREGSRDAIKALLQGDLRGAEEMFNAQGKSKVKPGTTKYDEKNDVYSWVDEGTGEQHVVHRKMMMALAGIAPTDLGDDHASGAGGMIFNKRTGDVTREPNPSLVRNSEPAIIQTARYIQENLKRMDGTPFDANEAWRLAKMSTENEKTVASKIYSDVMKEANEMGMELTPEQAQKEVATRMQFIRQYDPRYEGNSNQYGIPDERVPAYERSGNPPALTQDRLNRSGTINRNPRAPYADGTRLKGPDGRDYIVRGGKPVPLNP